MWDTESGKVVMDATNGKVPYCGTWYPLDNNIILVGSANKRIVQYDIRTGAVELEYNYHLGAVNTITFVDEARRIVSTSDDKKVLVWEFNTPVPNKYIQGEGGTEDGGDGDGGTAPRAKAPPATGTTARPPPAPLQTPRCTPSPPWRCTLTEAASWASPWTTRSSCTTRGTG